MKKEAAPSILSALKRGPKKGLTAKVIAARTGIKVTTVQTTLWTLRHEGEIRIAGAVRVSQVGRPSNLYTLA